MDKNEQDRYKVWAKLKGEKRETVFGWTDDLDKATFIAQTCETHGVYGSVIISLVSEGRETLVASVER